MMETEMERLVAWLDRLADQAERDASIYGRFPSLRDATLHDAKNYRASTKGARRALSLLASERQRSKTLQEQVKEMEADIESERIA